MNLTSSLYADRERGSDMHFLKHCLGISICWGVAVSLTLLLRDGGENRLAAPVICLLGLIPTATYCGRVAGFIGSVGAS